MVTSTSFTIEVKSSHVLVFLSEHKLNYRKEYEKDGTFSINIMDKNNPEIGLLNIDYDNPEIKSIFKTFRQIQKNSDSKQERKIVYSIEGFVYQISVLSEKQSIILDIKNKNHHVKQVTIDMTLSDIDLILNNIRQYMGYMV